MRQFVPKADIPALFAHPLGERRRERRVVGCRRAAAYIGFTFVASAPRQLKMKDRTSGDTNRNPDPTIVALDDRPADRETHSHAACFGREHWLKMRLRLAKSIPFPVSAIETRTVLYSLVSDVMDNTRGSAAETIDSMALITRFRITCCN